MLRSSAIAVAIIAGLALPVVVFAESQVDPHASSPAGAVYEIPLQTARTDGAPRGGSGGSNSNNQGVAVAPGGGGAGGGGVLPSGSAIKSENGYGSSSRVPGLSKRTAAALAAAAARKAATAGAASATKAAKAVAVPAIDTSRTSDEPPSLTGAYGLIALIVLGGAAAGIAAASATRRSRTG